MSLAYRFRNRAVTLLRSFFGDDDARARRVIVNQAFGGCERDPRSAIEYAGYVEIFPDHVVETLLRHGCAGKGRHSLSVLIETMAGARGRQPDPDFAELPPLLDRACEQPTRDEELAYLARLLADIRAKARKYSALRAVGALNPALTGEQALDADLDEADIALLCLQRTVERESHPFEDILDAFTQVQTAALLGAPGAGKSTTLRRLAADLARKAQSAPAAPLPLFVALGEWTGDEPLDTFIGAHIPEIGWALNGLTRTGRLVLLLDGLNEVPTTKRKAKAEDVKALINRLTSALSGPGGPPADDSLRKAQIIVSCRRDDYRDELDLGLDTLSLEPLTPRRVRSALHQWVTDRGEPPEDAERLFWQLAGAETLAAVFAAWERAGRSEDAFWVVADPPSDDDLPADIDWNGQWVWRECVQDPRSLLRLAANPFMLNMLYQVWRAGGALPRNRGDLFARFIDRLLAREHLVVKQSKTGKWERTADGERLLVGLAKVARGMQRERLERDPEEAEDSGVLTVLSRDAAAALLGGEDGLRRAEDATVLEVTSGVRFRHQLLQEYFTASALGQHSPYGAWPSAPGSATVSVSKSAGAGAASADGMGMGTGCTRHGQQSLSLGGGLSFGLRQHLSNT
ncbi:MAG: NACHT domain-containing protein [Gammaproteobacteria bacterium]|jgi:Mrp family chromosome partitioning ATPase|nr:NACHT domain-containing protein [Gammaproteobacteria bacterium]